jgi:hypothetical protein
MAHLFGPPVTIESSVYRGFTTWVRRRAVPQAKIRSFDIDLCRLRRTENGVKYVEADVSKYDFGALQKENTSAIALRDKVAFALLIPNLSWETGYRGSNITYVRLPSRLITARVQSAGEREMNLASDFGATGWSRWAAIGVAAASREDGRVLLDDRGCGAEALHHQHRHIAAVTSRRPHSARALVGQHHAVRCAYAKGRASLGCSRDGAHSQRLR